MAPTAATAARVTRPEHLAAEPEHDHQPERDRREVRDLHRGDRPELTGEPSLVERAAGRHQQAEQHRAEHDAERPQLAFDEQQVTSARPGRQQPERGDELTEPDRPVQGTDDMADRVDARDERLDEEQGQQAEEHVRADEHPAIRGPGHEQRGRQRALRHELADHRRDRHDQRQPVPGPLVEGQDVQEHQAPGQGHPAAQRLRSYASAGRDSRATRRAWNETTDGAIDK